MQQQQQTTTPASAGVDFDDAKKTPRRLGLVFGVGYYRSGERHGERFEIDRGAQFPPIIIYILRRPWERELRFVFVFLLFSTIDRERRAEDHLLLQFYQKTTPPTRARARFRAKEKKGGEEEEEEENNGLEDGIRFDLSFFFLSTTGVVGTSLFQ